MKNRLSYFFILSISFLLFSCDSGDQYEGPSPVDLMIRDMIDQPTFSIMLYDMQLDEDNDQYQHKYRVKTNIEDSLPTPKITEWVNVSELFFAENIDNMGLELASKSEDGTIHKAPSPPGFNNAVGNPKYGEWRTDNGGNSFWAFYGQYAFMSAMFNMARPAYRSTYYDYRDYRSRPNTRGNPYYGSGTNRYGTNSPSTRASNPSFFQRKQNQQRLSSFRNKVKSNPKRYSRSSRVGRSSSRNGYSGRSRGSRFGK